MLALWVFSKGMVQEEAPSQGDCPVSWSWTNSHRGSGDSYIVENGFQHCAAALFLPIAESEVGREYLWSEHGLNESGEVPFSAEKGKKLCSF